jgi:acetylglutamate synthase
MKKTLLEKARVAIGELNETTLLMRKQIESREFDATAVKNTMDAAMRKAKRIQSIYFYGPYTDEDIRQMNEFTDANLDTEIDSSIGQLNDALTPYAEAVGWTLLPAKKRRITKTPAMRTGKLVPLDLPIRTVPTAADAYFRDSRKTRLDH